jgi:hypothetical protein
MVLGCFWSSQSLFDNKIIKLVLIAPLVPLAIEESSYLENVPKLLRRVNSFTPTEYYPLSTLKFTGPVKTVKITLAIIKPLRILLQYTAGKARFKRAEGNWQKRGGRRGEGDKRTGVLFR